MSDLETSSIKATCTELSIAYARYVDFGDYDAFVELFSEDAVLNLGFKLPLHSQIVSCV